VATVHDLIIHPDLQGFGLGSTMLKRIVAQISDRGVYDVGTVTPSQLQPFFRSCSFDLDREDSVPMALRHGSSGLFEVEQINRPLHSNAKLNQLLQQVML
jgi:N-acetylglutamate synthase-like GNAT family acetyltransferase